MKKFILFLLIILFLSPLPLKVNLSYASNSLSIYAKVENNGIYLYSSPKNEIANRLFELPNSYFVRLIENANEDFYYCVYKDVYGYVLKKEVTAMEGVPNRPFVEANFRIYALEGLGLYTSPSILEQNKKVTIPYLTDNLTYYGTMIGQEAVPDKSDVWIYCKYNYDKITYGYVYSVFCDKLPTISTNTERFNIIEKPFLNKSQSSPKELTSVAMGFIIVGVSLPCLIVLFLLVRPSMIKNKVKVPKTKFKGGRNKDYFEFDESDLN